jgi:hypothetical protein
VPRKVKVFVIPNFGLDGIVETIFRRQVAKFGRRASHLRKSKLKRRKVNVGFSGRSRV